MEELIVQTAEKHFFFEELESDGDRVHIDRDDVDEDMITTSNNHHNARTEVGDQYGTLQIAYAVLRLHAGISDCANFNTCTLHNVHGV